MRPTCGLLFLFRHFAEGQLQLVYYCAQSGKKTRAAIFVAVSDVDPSSVFGEDCKVDVEFVEIGVVWSES